MTRTKIDYAIDLGTTNSSIARMENGSPIIKKSTTGSTQTDTTPSCVSIGKHNYVGTKSYRILGSERLSAFDKNDLTLINSFEEFKRNMGTDAEYKCKNIDKILTPEELSAEVLKTLRGYIRDEEMNAVVITVPAKFQGYQDDATKKAAKLAGFQYCELLQEPIAASMAYNIDAQTIDGDWLVFDFGGGTFDAALMRANEGIMKVVDTEGENYLGGKNIDYAIVDKIIIPYLEETYSIRQILESEKRKKLLRDAVKQFAEDIKIELSSKESSNFNISTEIIGKDDEGNGIEIDLIVTKEKYEEVVKPIFQRAIDLSQKLLKNNNLTGSDLSTVLMIGGPTLSETLRTMVRDQITSNVNISIDPMTAVAKGAALFASTKNIPEGIREIDKSKIQLNLRYATDTVETEEKFGIKVMRDKTEGKVPEKLFVELMRQDKGWTSGKVEIKDDVEILDIILDQGRSNGFTIIITDDKGGVFPSEPDSFSIIQGLKVAGATLPFDLCIDILDIASGKQQLDNIKGLGKNQPLPAKGTGIYCTQKDIRPGNKNDQIRIPIYYDKKGTRAIYNDLRGEPIITGEDLSGILPKGSEVELTIWVDESRMVKVSASFPYLEDFIVDVQLPEYKRQTPEKEHLERELEKANTLFENMEEECTDLDSTEVQKIRGDLGELKNLLETDGSDTDTRNQVLNRLRGNLKEIDNLEGRSECPKVMRELTEALEHLEAVNEQFGDDKTTQIVQQLKEDTEFVLKKEDLKMAKDLMEKINSVHFSIVDQGAGVALEISMIKGFDDNFDMHEWKNKSQAKQLINEAKEIINGNRATKQNLKPIVGQLFQLLPSAQQGIIDDEVLVK